jgi:hypothetical protein
MALVDHVSGSCYSLQIGSSLIPRLRALHNSVKDAATHINM